MNYFYIYITLVTKIDLITKEKNLIILHIVYQRNVYDDIERCIDFYIFSSLAVEVELLLWKTKLILEKDRPSINSLSRCDQYLFPTIYYLLIVLGTLPVLIQSHQNARFQH